MLHFTLLEPFPALELALTGLLASINRGREWKVNLGNRDYNVDR
jgi:hypothetical protein